MALREIRLAPDPILRQRAKPVIEVTPKVVALLDDMRETLLAKDGIGLAAPQVGILRRILVVYIHDEFTELINPEIIETRGLVIGMEGCLSMPDEGCYVRRPHYVRMKGLDRNGNQVVLEATGLKSVALCHEMDHLIGVLFTDRKVEPTPSEQQLIDESNKKQGFKDEMVDPAVLSVE
ncbi:MAG: peptide deformylase [Defluviitaleaceae bacterium]|nr:peptide deformylase [Defluviitaleaceae bacterium]